MGKIVMELTNRCNLSCEHCFSGRHGGKDDLPIEVLQKVLTEARELGFDELSFTGGEPTIHRQFSEVIRLTHEAGYRFSFVTNGWSFSRTYPVLASYLDRLGIITFSMDGATEETHDRLRGKGSYRRLMQAISLCFMKDVPFAINMVVAAHNRHELGAMVEVAGRLGSRGVRFGHLMPAPTTTRQGLDLSPEDRKAVDAEIWLLRSRHTFPIEVAPGYYTTDLFPCAPLQLQELNIDCQGKLGKCCHLSGHGPGVGSGDVVGDLASMSFAEAHRRLVEENAEFHAQKIRRLAGGELRDSDYFPCWYCSVHFEKVSWLKEIKDHAWSDLIR